MELNSRIHHLPTFDTEKAQVFLKREDELGFGISGCKKRKYLSLIPFLQERAFDVVYIIGGENSNNLVGLAQSLNEVKIPFIAFIKVQKNPQLKGNSLLLNLLSTATQRIYISTDKWDEVEQIAKNHLLASGQNGYIIPEGASCTPSIKGLCTLMVDIQRNEVDAVLSFDHIFIDSGTAYTAATLVAMNRHFVRESQIHVVHIAGDEQHFKKQYQSVKEFLFPNEVMASSSPTLNMTHHHFPITARSFGSVNSSIKQFIYEMAQSEGVLVDPIYTAKLLMTAKNIISSQLLSGNILIIHSGGGTGLMGFDF